MHAATNKTTTESILTPSQIETYLQNGVLVADQIFTEDEIQTAIHGLHSTLHKEYQIDVHNLLETGHKLCSLSSTNGSGGVLDVFYPDFKLNIGSNERLFQATTELWKAAHHYGDESALSVASLLKDHDDINDDNNDECYKYHPYGPFDPHRGYMYIDRIGYRLPSQLSMDIASRMEKSPVNHNNGRTIQSKKRKGGIQRCLTPHLDCCPDTFYNAPEKKSKWRPIQCFVSLTDNLEPNTGGFEAALGFHRTFHTWAKHRIGATRTNHNNNHNTSSTSHNPLCVGEYTHIRPKEDQIVMKAIQHIPVRKGSVVFFDNRIPHANAYRHTGTHPRAVIYCSFLPDVQINRMYAAKQLKEYYARKIPNDTWIRVKDEEEQQQQEEEEEEQEHHHNDCNHETYHDEMHPNCNRKQQDYSFSELGRKLMMMDPWD